MGFQSTVRYDLAFGVQGEIKNSYPALVRTGLLNSADAAYNIVGATVFTSPVAGGRVAAGGAIGNSYAFHGILANPKVYAGTLTATMTLANDVQAEFLYSGELVVKVPAACKIGDKLVYNTTTGAISTVEPVAAFTGVIAVTTGVLTVSAISAGSIGVGSVLYDASGNELARVTGLGTGTGGNGTYNTNIATAVSSQAMTSPSVAASGKAFVPNASIQKFAQTASGGLALALLANA